MFDCVLYSSFYKPDNSTKLPSGGDTFPCVMVEPCSILNPSISFNQGNAWNPTLYNYAYIAELHRYYWVNNWTWNGGRWYAEMDVDALASWKTEILSREEYVVRSQVEYDGNIIDSLYPAETNYANSLINFSPFSADDVSTGTYVLGVANGKASSKGGVTYYCGSQDEMSSLFEFMYSSTDWLNGASIDDISQDLLKCLVNPAQYLTSLMWFPVGSAEISSNVSGYVGAGWWQTDTLLSYIKGTLTKSFNWTRPTHPQSARGNYLNYAPYTYTKLYVPGFPIVEINLEKFPPGSKIYATIQIDTITGNGTLFVHPEGNTGAGQQVVGQIGVPVSLTSMQSDILGGLTTIGSQLGNATNIASAIFGTIGAVADAAKLVSPDVSVQGTNGNMSVFLNKGCLSTTCKQLVNEDIAHHGRPLFQRKLLSSLSGFTQIRDMDTNLPCTYAEQQMIRAFAEKGFYIE